MAHQTKINESNGAPKPTSRGLARDVGEFAHDVLTLAELQVQLLAADARECRRHLLAPGLLLLSGATLCLICVPIALTALALWLSQFFHLSYAMGFLSATVAGVVLGAMLSALGWNLIRKRAAMLGRSQQELVRNLQWIKKVLQRHRITRNKTTDNSWRTMA